MARIDNPTYVSDFSHVLAITVAKGEELAKIKPSKISEENHGTLTYTFRDKTWTGDISQADPLAAMVRGAVEAKGKKGAKPKTAEERLAAKNEREAKKAAEIAEAVAVALAGDAQDGSEGSPESPAQ